MPRVPEYVKTLRLNLCSKGLAIFELKKKISISILLFIYNFAFWSSKMQGIFIISIDDDR